MHTRMYQSYSAFNFISDSNANDNNLSAILPKFSLTHSQINIIQLWALQLYQA